MEYQNDLEIRRSIPPNLFLNPFKNFLFILLTYFHLTPTFLIGQDKLIKGELVYENKSFYSQDFKSINYDFELVTANHYFLYSSKKGILQNVDTNRIGYFKNTGDINLNEIDIPLFLVPDSINLTNFLENDTSILYTYDKQSMIDSGSANIKTYTDKWLYITKFYSNELTQEVTICYNIEYNEEMVDGYLKERIGNLPLYTSKKNISQPENDMGNAYKLKIDSSLSCYNKFSLQNNKQIIVYWYKSCLACHYFIDTLLKVNYLDSKSIIFINPLNSYADFEENSQNNSHSDLLTKSTFSDCFKPRAYPLVVVTQNGRALNYWEGYSDKNLSEVLNLMKI